MPAIRMALLIAIILLPACAPPPENRDADGGGDGGTFIRGTAKVISVNLVLGQTVLEFQGRQIDAYWQKQTQFAQSGVVYQQSPLTAPIGHYVEPIVKDQDFAATPGDTISFVGMKTGNEIFLRGIQVIAR